MKSTINKINEHTKKEKKKSRRQTRTYIRGSYNESVETLYTTYIYKIIQNSVCKVLQPYASFQL